MIQARSKFTQRVKYAGIGLASVAAIGLIAGPGQAQATLTMNGKVVSQDVRSVGGSPMVKLADVAKALGMIVVKRPGGYEITKAGGANQVGGKLQGAIGDVLFDGYWRFQVLSVEMPDSYLMRLSEGANDLHYDANTHEVSAHSGYQVVAVHCRMTNGQKTMQTFWLGRLPEEKINNALTDTEGGSYAPDCYDIQGSISQSKPLLPGARTDFVMLFSVPSGTRLKDLIFTLKNNDSRSGNDVRVALAKE